MVGVFIELSVFARYREQYLDDDAFRALQAVLMENPTAGEVMPGTGGLRKIRFSDSRRCKGKRGGLRVIYYWWTSGLQFWLFTLYDKDEARDLTPQQRKVFKAMVKTEIDERREQK